MANKLNVISEKYNDRDVLLVEEDLALLGDIADYFETVVKENVDVSYSYLGFDEDGKLCTSTPYTVGQIVLPEVYSEGSVWTSSDNAQDLMLICFNRDASEVGSISAYDVSKPIYYHGITLNRKNASGSDTDDNVRFTLSIHILSNSETPLTFTSFCEWVLSLKDIGVNIMCTGMYKLANSNILIASYIFADSQGGSNGRMGIIGGLPTTGGISERTESDISLGKIFAYPELQFVEKVNKVN